LPEIDQHIMDVVVDQRRGLHLKSDYLAGPSRQRAHIDVLTAVKSQRVVYEVAVLAST
jgi:hypothetical protein